MRFMIRRLRHFAAKLPYNSWIREIIERRGITGFERYRKVASLLSRIECCKILDVGSYGPSPLEQMGFQVLSVDVQRRAGLDVVADASNLPFGSNVFDCITAIDVLEHIGSSREKAIKELFLIPPSPFGRGGLDFN